MICSTPSPPVAAGPPQYRGQGAVARDAGPASIMPINSLNSYQNRWTIKARVTHKSDIRRCVELAEGLPCNGWLVPADLTAPHFPPGMTCRYTNARGEGRFFSFDLLDAQGGEIRAVGWNDQVRARAAGGPRIHLQKVGTLPEPYLLLVRRSGASLGSPACVTVPCALPGCSVTSGTRPWRPAGFTSSPRPACATSGGCVAGRKGLKALTMEEGYQWRRHGGSGACMDVQ